MLTKTTGRHQISYFSPVPFALSAVDLSTCKENKSFCVNLTLPPFIPVLFDTNGLFMLGAYYMG